MSVSLTDEMTSDSRVELITPRRTRLDGPHPTITEANSETAPVVAAALDGEQASEAAAMAAAPLPEADLSEADLLEIAEPTPAMLAAVAGETVEIEREQLQLQVAQLAGHLRERLREVDRREATLNARVAQLEADLRASRVWIRERELAFQERENELRQEIEELREASASPRAVGQIEHDKAAIDWEARQAEWNEREHQLRLREDDLRERRLEIDRQAIMARHAQQLWQQQREREEQALARERERIAGAYELQTAERAAALTNGEQLLAEHAAALDRDRVALVADRHAWEERRARQEEALNEQRRAAEAEAADLQTRLAARAEWIERQKSGLEQVRDEALALHRQSLEMRLLAEQLWSQITGRLNGAEVTQSLAHLRVQLAEQYKLEEESLVARRTQLVALGERIKTEHQELVQLRDGLRQWGAARQQEIERQAAQLVERELTLDAQQETFHQAEQAWRDERRGYEQQIRDLLAQLRSAPAAA